MTGCGEWLEPLSAALDGALPAAEREGTEAHVAACAECDRRLASLRALKHAVARLSSREDPPGSVRAHVEALALRGRGGLRFAVALPLLLAAGLAAGTWALLSVHRAPTLPAPQLADELAADHLHSVPEAMPAEVVTDDPETAIRFFSDRVPFPPVAPRLEGARLIGGRLCKIHGHRVQLLFYRVDTAATLSLFVSDQDLGSGGCREARGLHVCGRRAYGLSLVAVASSPPDELRRLLDSAAVGRTE